MAIQITTELGDAELVRRSLAGESQAFGRLIEKYQALIYGLAYNRVGNTADAQDIAQDVFVRAFRKLKQLDDPDSFGAWIKSITANECKTWLRNQHPTVSLDESEYSPTHDSAAQSIWRYDEFRSEVAQAIHALPERNREVITLYYLSGMTCEEIAESLETTPAAVQSRLHRSRQLLKAEFTGEIEQVLGERRLPDEFSRDVLRRATLHPVAPGYMCGDAQHGQVGVLFLGVSQGEGTDTKLIAVSIRSDDVRGIIMPHIGINLGQTSPELIDVQLRAYRAAGMELMEIMLYLDECGHCMARAEFRQGRTKCFEMMKPSRAIALARRAPADILVEETVAELRRVGEDGLRWDREADLDGLMYTFRALVGVDQLMIKAFSIGIDVGRGHDTAQVARDTGRRTIHLSIIGTGATATMEFGDDPIWVDYLWELAALNEQKGYLHSDGSCYKVFLRLHGDDVEIRCSSTESWGVTGTKWSSEAGPDVDGLV